MAVLWKSYLTNLGLRQNFVASFLDKGKVLSQQVARMLVPKMVNNGFNSVLQTSAGSRRLVAA